jgi:hypothetical protein
MAYVNPMVLQEHLDALCPELAAVVNDAVASGNELAESWRGFGQAVRLSAPSPMLVGIDQSVREHLAYTPVDDPHYWLGEIHCLLHPEWFSLCHMGLTPAPLLLRWIFQGWTPRRREVSLSQYDSWADLCQLPLVGRVNG